MNGHDDPERFDSDDHEQRGEDYVSLPRPTSARITFSDDCPLVPLSAEDREKLAVFAATLNRDALAEVNADRDTWRRRAIHLSAKYELLTDLLRRAIVDQPMTPASLMATLEEGDWRPLCPACKDIDCLGCDDGMYERAEAALLVDYQAWVHFDDLARDAK